MNTGGAVGKKAHWHTWRNWESVCKAIWDYVRGVSKTVTTFDSTTPRSWACAPRKSKEKGSVGFEISVGALVVKRKKLETNVTTERGMAEQTAED